MEKSALKEAGSLFEEALESHSDNSILFDRTNSIVTNDAYDGQQNIL